MSENLLVNQSTVGTGTVAPPAGRDPLRHSPVFVVAPARSHTSVTVSMLGQHPQLRAFPELILFRAATVGKLLAPPTGESRVPLKARTAGLLRALAQEHEGVQSEESIERALAWLRAREGWTAADVLDHLLAMAAPATGVEKSPENTGRDDFLSRMNAAYPLARYLHLVRHPATTVASMREAWLPINYWNVQPELFHQFCLAVWYHQHSRILRFSRHLPAARYRQVRSEDILNHPKENLPELCRWLGIDASPDAVNAMCHPENSSFARRGPASAPCGHDPKFVDSPTLRPAVLPETLQLPREWVIDPWNHLLVLELGRKFGY
jgi:sulfotransferase family protein